MEQIKHWRKRAAKSKDARSLCRVSPKSLAEGMCTTRLWETYQRVVAKGLRKAKILETQQDQRENQFLKSSLNSAILIIT